MEQTGTGLSRQKGKCIRKSNRINNIGQELVFRGAKQMCTRKPNEISAFASELVFRDVPG